jgi:WD40 repeat protein
LAEDLGRNLRNEPTLARPAGAVERVVRWCRRKPALSATVIALILVGGTGLVGILMEWRRAEAESLKFRLRSYVADMDLANRALNEGDLGTAQSLLRRYWPEPHAVDLRHWEWRYLANLSEGDPHSSLAAHSSPVMSLRFVDANTLLTAGSGDWRTVLWNLDERRPSNIFTNRGFGGTVGEAAAVAPSRHAMYFRPAWHLAKVITAMDLQKGTETTLTDANAAVRSLELSPDEKVLAVASANQVNLWDLDLKAWVQSFETEAKVATQGLFSPDGTRLVIADDTGHIAFWNVAEHWKVDVLTITNAPDGLGVLQFSADGRWLVNPGGKWPTQIWSVQDRTLVAELRDSAFAEHAVFSADGRWLAIVGGDPTIRLWETSDWRNWRKTRTLRGHTDPITAVDFSPKGHLLATGARNGEVKLWSLGEPTKTAEGVSFPTSRFFQTAGDGRGFCRIPQPALSNGVAFWTAEVWTTTPLQQSFKVALAAGAPSSGVVLAGCRGLVLGGYDGSIRVFNPGVGKEMIVSNAHKAEVYITESSLDGSTLATKGMEDAVNPEDRVRIWRLPRLEPIAELPHAETVHGIKLSNDGKLLAGFTGPGDVGVWEIPSMKGPPMWHGIGAAQRVKVCAFSPDNRWLAAATPDDGGAFLWELSTHRRVALPRAVTLYTSLSFSPDGSRLAAGSEGERKLFDVASGQVVLSFKDPGLQLAFARDGERLLAVHGEGAFLFHAPAFDKLQFDWLKQRTSEEPPAYLGPETNYSRPDRP